jgi:cell division protein FtsB
MRGLKPLLTLARSVAGRALGLAVVGFFAVYAVFGANGVLAWGDYSSRISSHTAELQRLRAEEAVLSNRVRLLDPRHADPDLVDEITRRELGLAQPDEVIIPLR